MDLDQSESCTVHLRFRTRCVKPRPRRATLTRRAPFAFSTRCGTPLPTPGRPTCRLPPPWLPQCEREGADVNAKAREHTTSWETAAYREGAVACNSAGAATVHMETNTSPRIRAGRLCCGAQSAQTTPRRHGEKFSGTHLATVALQRYQGVANSERHLVPTRVPQQSSDTSIDTILLATDRGHPPFASSRHVPATRALPLFERVKGGEALTMEPPSRTSPDVPGESYGGQLLAPYRVRSKRLLERSEPLHVIPEVAWEGGVFVGVSVRWMRVACSVFEAQQCANQSPTCGWTLQRVTRSSRDVCALVRRRVVLIVDATARRDEARLDPPAPPRRAHGQQGRVLPPCNHDEVAVLWPPQEQKQAARNLLSAVKPRGPARAFVALVDLASILSVRIQPHLPKPRAAVVLLLVN